MIRVGIGYDVHRLVTGRKLILGGVEIPFDRGLDGHSDAYVLLHRIADAHFGPRFPDNDEGIRSISSIEILRFVRTLLAEKNARATNVDVTMVAEAPKLQPHIEQMRAKIGTALGCDASRINIKATTNEGLGTIGRGEGMATIATAIVEDL
jgi:2-C-methyl-D-erythritol 2,4-cyclodiphosphate synthase